MKCHKKCLIVRKGASALPFFFHPPPVLDIPLFFRNMQPLPPPSTQHCLDTTHHWKIPDSLMIHWNQGD